MTTEVKDGACLVARAVPCQLPGSAEDAAGLLEQLSLHDKKLDAVKNEKVSRFFMAWKPRQR